MRLKFAKKYEYDQIFLFLRVMNKGSKNPEFYADLKFVEVVLKKCSSQNV